MGFLHPLIFAGGIAALSLPILIHFLLRRRRTPVPWGAMRFLQEAIRRQRRRLQLEQWLLLALRCLVVLLLALGLARPLFGAAQLGARAKELVIVIDDTIASGARAAEGTTELERTRESAARLIDALDTSRGDRATIITLARPAQMRTAGPTGDAPALAGLLRTLEPTDAPPDWRSAGELVRRALADTGDARDPTVAVLSALRQGTLPADGDLEPLASEAQRVTDVRLLSLAPAEDPAPSVAVTNVQPIRSVAVTEDLRGPAGQIAVDLRRDESSAGDATTTRVSVHALRLDAIDESGATIAESVVKWSPGQTERRVTLTPRMAGSFEPGPLVYRAQARTAGDRLPADDNARAAVDIRRTLRVGVLASSSFGRGGLAQFGPGDWMGLALRPDEAAARDLEVRRIEPASAAAARLGALDAALVLEPGALSPAAWNEIARIHERGGLVLIAPDPSEGAQTWPDRALLALALDLELATDPAAHDPPSPINADRERMRRGPLRLLAGEARELAAGVTVSRALPLATLPESWDAPLRLSGGEPLLIVRSRAHKGDAGAADDEDQSRAGVLALLLAAPDLSWTNLPTRPLFVPLVQELVRQGIATGASAQPAIAGDGLSPPPTTVELVPLGDSPEATLARDGTATAAPMRFAGAWHARARDGSGTGVLIANPAADAAALAPTPRDVVSRRLGPWLGDGEMTWLSGSRQGAQRAGTVEPRDALAGEGSRRPFDWPLLVMAGVLAAIEVAAARFASHAEREGAAAV